MAIFEKQLANKISLDDTDPLKCSIENAHNVNGHTEYSVRVQRGPNRSDSWCVSRRYSEFASLNSALHAADTRSTFPPKKILGNMNPEFIAERRNGLQLYLDSVTNNFFLSSSLPLKNFLDPRNYPLSFSESALQNVSMAMRGDGNFELKNALNDIGWRIRKHHYLVSKNQMSDENFLISWQTYGPDRFFSERDMQIIFKSLMNLEHPCIDKIMFIHSLETGTYAVRKLHSNGSVKDQIYGTQYKNSYINKYGNPKQRKPFTLGQITHYGYQILKTLKFLHEKGFPYGHLHTGNLAIENQRILLMDVENSILGVPTRYRQFLLKHKKIYSMQDVDIYCFGHTLYEMAYAQELSESTCETFLSHVSDDLVSVLQMILSPAACKQGMPTIDMILSHPFFTMTSSVVTELDNSFQSHFKIPNSVKEQLKQNIANIESRLKNDQKLVYREKKQIRIQEILSSEEEVRKRKRRNKNKENSMYRSSSLNGLSPSNLSAVNERSASVASTLSTTSSHTSPHINDDTPNVGMSTMPTPSSPSSNNRSVLLDAICSFNKASLTKTKKS